MSPDQPRDQIAPHPLGNATRHYWLISQMAKLTQADIVRAMEQAALTQADWAEMITKCRGCTWSDGCEQWLQGRDRPVASAPEPCLNRERFEALKTVLEELMEESL